MLPLIITIPDYIRKVKLSEKRQPIYWEYKDGKIKAGNKLLPSKYFTEEGLKNVIRNNGKILYTDLKPCYRLRHYYNNRVTTDTTKKCYLCLKTGDNVERLISNPDKVGTPNMKIINSQDMYSGKVREHTRGALVVGIKQFMFPFVQNLSKITDYPVRLKLYLYDTVQNEFDNTKDKDVEGRRWDLGNRTYFYIKCFLDLISNDARYGLIDFKKILIDDDRLHITEESAVFCPINKSEKKKLVFVLAKDDENFHKVIEPFEKDRLNLLKNNLHYK